MSADAAPLTAGLSAAEQACAKALESTDRLSTALDALTEEMAANREAADSAGEAHSASASAIGMATQAWGLALAAVEKVVGALVEFGDQAIESAQAMDPGAAIRWSSSVDGLRSAWATLTGTLAKQVMPAIEAVMDEFTKLFQTLAKYDWKAIFAELFHIIDSIVPYVKTIGTGILDALTWPFRTAISMIEEQMATAMTMLGDIMNKFAGTGLGKRLGLDAHIGDALAETGRDMTAQAAKIKGSFAGLASEVGNGIKVGLTAAVDAVAGGGSIKRLQDAMTVKSSGPGNADGQVAVTKRMIDMEATAFGIRMAHEKEIFDLQTVADQHHIAQIRQEVAEKKQAALAEYSEAKNRVGKAETKLTEDQGKNADMATIAADQKALNDAMADMGVKGANAVKLMSDAVSDEARASGVLKAQAEDTKLAYTEARAMADKAAEAAAAGSHKGALDVRASEAKQAADMLEGQYKQQAAEAWTAQGAEAKLKTQTAHEVAQIGKDATELQAKRLEDAAKVAAKIAEEIKKNHESALKGAVTGSAGIVMGGVEAAAKTGDPMAALLDVVIGIVAKSKGFTDLMGAVNKLLDDVGGALGQLFEGLTPIIQMTETLIAPLLNALGSVLEQVGGALVAILQPIMMALNPLIMSLSDLLVALGPLIPLTVQFAMLVSGEGPALDIAAEALKLLSPAIELLAKGIKLVVDAIAGVWNWIVDEIASVFKALEGIPLVGGIAKDAATDIEAMKVQVNAVTPAAEGAAAALTQLQGAGTDITSAFGVMRNVLADANARNLASTEVSAYNGLGQHDAGSGDLFNVAFAKGMNDQVLEPLISTMNTVQANLSGAQSNDSSAIAKVAMDDATIRALRTAIGQTSDPAVVAALQKQLTSTEASEVLDLDAQRLADAQLAVQQDQLTVAKDALQMQILQLEYDEAGREGNSAAQASLLDAMIALGDDQTAALTAKSTDLDAVQQAMVQQAKDQAAASISSNGATNANTKATKDNTQALTNMVSGFNTARYTYNAQVDSARDGAGETDAQPWKHPVDMSSVTDEIKKHLQMVAQSGGGSGMHIHGDVKVEVDSRDPGTFADRVEAAMRLKTFRKRGLNTPGTSGEFP
jgi:hypothetical protein